MSSSMQAYLASKYMSGPKADAIMARTTSGPKKKKRKVAKGASASSSMIKEDDLGGWAEHVDEPEDETEEAVVAEDRGFKKRQKEGDAGWTTVREPTPPPEEDEQPQVVAEEGVPFKGGLLTSSQLKKTLPKRKKAEVSEADRAAAQETVYRDASGRKIDVAAERAEAARKKREREEQEAKKMEWGKGLVQREEAEKQKRELEAMKTASFARSRDDVALNEDLKAQDRWNDPAAAFLSKKRAKGPRKPEYAGPPPPPNRFGIRPGYRWDGVDRSTGFEKKYFQRINERKRQGAASYEWSVDEM